MRYMEKINFRFVLLIVFIYISVFYPLLQNISDIFRYWDETIIILFLVCLFSNPKSIKKYCKDKCVIFYALFILVGMINTAIFHIQPFDAVIEDVASFLKFPMAIGFAYIFFKGNEIEQYRKILTGNLVFITIILMLLLTINQVFNIFPTSENGFLFRGEVLFYERPTYLAGAVTFLICIAFLVIDKKKPLIITGVCLILIGLATTRSKFIGWVIAMACIWFIQIKRAKKLKIWQLCSIVVILLLAAGKKLIKYFVTYSNAARGLLYSKSIQIFRDYFPFGTGFATFATNASRKVYSPLYVKYEMNDVHGFTNDLEAVNYISDTFWPIIISEFGIFGIIFFFLFLVMLFTKIQKLFDKNPTVYFSALAALGYLGICSIAESAFVNPIAVPLGFIIGFSFKINEYNADTRH